MEKFYFTFKGRTFFYVTLDEAEKMARFMGVPIADVKEVDIR